jgi:hypothetical protein
MDGKSLLIQIKFSTLQSRFPHLSKVPEVTVFELRTGYVIVTAEKRSFILHCRITQAGD